jgi:hypothetical protein
VTKLRELQMQRERDCRLTPDLALESLDEADAFLRERGLLTLTPSCSLPSLFEACQEEPYDAAKRGFAQWPKTKWWWGGGLAEREGVYLLKIHRGKSLYLAPEVAALADPICRAELERMAAADPGWARLLQHLAAAGPSLLDELQAELGLSPRELKALRSPLERCGAIVSRQVRSEAGPGHVHTSELARWDQVHPDAVEGKADLGPLVVAGVRAAVVAPEDEPRRWFAWPWRWEEELVDRLVAEGRLDRPEPGWLAVPG